MKALTTLTTLKTAAILAFLLLPGFVEAQQQVIVVPETKQEFYGVDTSDPIVGYLNWNIARNAAIGDALRYEQMKPVPKVIIQQQAVQPIAPSQPVAPSAFAPVANPWFPAPQPLNYGGYKR